MNAAAEAERVANEFGLDHESHSHVTTYLPIVDLLPLADTKHEYGPMNPANFTDSLLDDKAKQIVDTLERRDEVGEGSRNCDVLGHAARPFKLMKRSAMK